MNNVVLGRKYRKKHKGLSSFLSKNPVITLGLDLPFLIVCSTTLKIGVALSIEMFIIHLATMIAALITVRFLPLWSRMLVNVGISFVMMTVARYLITWMFPDITNYVGMYIYLMAVNGITIYQCSEVTKRSPVLPTLAGAFLNALGFSVTMLLVSLFREYWASGTLWGLPVSAPIRLSGIALPFSGFILIGFLLAAVRAFNKAMLAYSINEAIRRDAHYTDLPVSGDEGGAESFE